MQIHFIHRQIKTLMPIIVQAFTVRKRKKTGFPSEIQSYVHSQHHCLFNYLFNYKFTCSTIESTLRKSSIAMNYHNSSDKSLSCVTPENHTLPHPHAVPFPHYRFHIKRYLYSGWHPLSVLPAPSMCNP